MPGFQGCTLTNVSAVTVANTTWQPIVFLEKEFDITESSESWTTDNSVITIPSGVTKVQFSTNIMWNTASSSANLNLVCIGCINAPGFPLAPATIPTETDGYFSAWSDMVTTNNRTTTVLETPVMDVVAGQTFRLSGMPYGGDAQIVNSDSNFLSVKVIESSFTVKTDPSEALFTADNTWSGRNDFNGRLYSDGTPVSLSSDMTAFKSTLHTAVNSSTDFATLKAALLSCTGDTYH